MHLEKPTSLNSIYSFATEGATLVDAINRALTMTLPCMDIQLDGATRSIEVLAQLLEARR